MLFLLRAPVTSATSYETIYTLLGVFQKYRTSLNIKSFAAFYKVVIKPLFSHALYVNGRRQSYKSE